MQEALAKTDSVRVSCVAVSCRYMQAAWASTQQQWALSHRSSQCKRLWQSPPRGSWQAHRLQCLRQQACSRHWCGANTIVLVHCSLLHGTVATCRATATLPMTPRHQGSWPAASLVWR
jgi:hypothetical protein